MSSTWSATWLIPTRRGFMQRQTTEHDLACPPRIGRRGVTVPRYSRPMAVAPASPSLSATQLATLARLGEERTARIGDVLYRVGDATYPFVAIQEGEVAILDAAGNELVRHGPAGFLG